VRTAPDAVSAIGVVRGVAGEGEEAVGKGGVGGKQRFPWPCS
jgi:hypothetical protein